MKLLINWVDSSWYITDPMYNSVFPNVWTGLSVKKKIFLRNTARFFVLPPSEEMLILSALDFKELGMVKAEKRWNLMTDHLFLGMFFYLSLFSFSSSCPLGHASFKKWNYLCSFKIKVKPLIQFQDKLKIVHMKPYLPKSLYISRMVRHFYGTEYESCNRMWMCLL